MGPAWRNGGMSMRNPMSRQPMNNNPMGNQAPMQPNFGRAIGAIGATSLPYAGGGLGMAGPAGAAQGMSAMRPAPVRQQPQGNFYSRAMAGDPIYGQNSIGVQRAAQNVLMQQPPGADTRMRGLNIPGMQFDPNQNAMVRQQRPVMNPNEVVDRTKISGLAPMSDKRREQITSTRIARAGRLAGVRPQDMAQWRQQSPTAIALRNGAANTQMAAGTSNGTPAQMGTGGQMVGPPAPAAQPVALAQATAPASDSQQALFAQALQKNNARDLPIAAESMKLGRDPSISAGAFIARSAMNDANRVANYIGDTYMRQIHGDPQQQVLAGMEEKTKAQRDYSQMRTTQRQDQRAQWMREDAAMPVKSWMNSRIIAPLRGRRLANEQFRSLQNYAATPQPWRDEIYGQTRSYPGY